MSGPPTSDHSYLREQLRRLAAQTRDVLVPSNDLVMLLDLLDEQDTQIYSAWEHCMGEDL